MEKKVSLVTAKVVRENEQYSYKLVGRGEKYLVVHDETDNAGDIVIEKLTPFAKEPIVIEQVTLQKKVEIIGNPDEDLVYKISVNFIIVDEDSGKEKKSKQNFFVCGNSLEDALLIIGEHLDNNLSPFAIMSIIRTKIIDVLTN